MPIRKVRCTTGSEMLGRGCSAGGGDNEGNPIQNLRGDEQSQRQHLQDVDTHADAVATAAEIGWPRALPACAWPMQAFLKVRAQMVISAPDGNNVGTVEVARPLSAWNLWV